MKHFFLGLLCLGLLFAGFTVPLTAQSPDTALFQETLRIGRGAILHAEWNFDGTLILMDTVRGAWLYALGGSYLPDVTHIEAARLARFNPTRPLLAGVDDDNHITFWDTTTFEQVASLPGHDVYVRALAWNPDGSQLATLDRTGRIIIWDADRIVKWLELRLPGADEIAWNQNGSHLAAVDSDSGIVHVWRTTGDLVFIAPADHPSARSSGILWRDDTHLLRRTYYGEGSSGELLDITSGGIVPFPGVSYFNAYSPDGSKLATEYSILDAGSGELLFPFSTAQTATITWSPDGRLIAFGSWTGDINGETWVTIADGTTGKTVSSLNHDVTLKEIVWSPDSQTLLIVDSANRIFLRNSTLSTYSHMLDVPDTIAHTEIGTTAAWRDDGKIIAAADTNYGARLWDAETGQVLVTRMIGGQPFTRLAWQPGGTLLAAAGGVWWQSKNNNVYIWDSGSITESSTAHVLTIPHVDIVAGIAWSPDGQTLASAERSQYIRLWRPDMPGLIRVMNTYAIRLSPFIDYTQQINSLAWSPRGDLLDYSFSSSGNGGGVDLVDVAAGTLVNGDTPNNYASTWVWTPDNRLIWAKWGQYGDGASLEPRPPIHDITLGGEGITSEGESLPLLTGLTEEIRTAVFSPDARLLIGFDWLDNGIVWDVQTRTPLVHLSTVDNAVWSPDSTMLAVYGLDGLIRVLDPQTGAPLHTFNRHFYVHSYNPANNIQVIWSPDSQRVIVLDHGVLFIYDRLG